MNDFGDFEEVKEEKAHQVVEEAPVRVRLPREGQILGVVLERLGGNRMSVKCTDGKTRNCRVPGRYSKKFWIRSGNFVLVEPWEFDNDKADIVYQYRGNEANQLRKRGLIKDLDEGF